MVHSDETGWRINGKNDIRSVAAARCDGGVNPTDADADADAKAYGVAKSVVRTCRKNGLNFFRYGLDALAAMATDRPLSLPLAPSNSS